MISHENISEDEAALYDRQIRLWGLQAQSRLKSARLLLIGLSPVANEIVKNIVLCGINTLTICDDKLVRKSDVDQGFFYENSHIGLMRSNSVLNRVRVLNEMVAVNCENDINADFLISKYQDYDGVVIALDFCRGSFQMWMHYMQKFCVLPQKPKIYCVLTFGMHAIGFVDLGQCEWDGNTRLTTSELKSSFGDILNSNGSLPALGWSQLNDFINMSFHNLGFSPVADRMPKEFYLAQLLLTVDSPLSYANLKANWSRVAADLGVSEDFLTDDDLKSCCVSSSISINSIFGGIISQEIIKALSYKEEPKGNWFFMDGRTCEVNMLWLPTRT